MDILKVVMKSTLLETCLILCQIEVFTYIHVSLDLENLSLDTGSLDTLNN